MSRRPSTAARRARPRLVAGILVALGALLGAPPPTAAAPTPADPPRPPERGLIEVARVPLSGSTISSLGFSPDAERLAIGLRDGRALVWSVRRGRVERELAAGTGPVWAVALDPVDGLLLAVGGEDARVSVHDLRTGARAWTFEGHKAPVLCLAWHPSGTRLASGSEEPWVRVWDLRHRVEATRFRAHDGEVRLGLAFAPDGASLVSPGRAGTLVRWGVDDGRLERTFFEPGLRPVAPAVGPDGALFSGSREGYALEWDEESGRVARRLGAPGAPVNAVAVAAGGRELAVVRADGELAVWDLETGRRLDRLVPGRGWLATAAFAPRGGRLAVGGQDGTVRIYSLDPAGDERVGGP